MQEKDILDQIRQECSSVSKNDFSSILESIDNMSPSAGTETVRTGSGRKNIFVKYAAIAAACILPVSLAVWVHRNTAFTGGNGTGGEIDAGVVTEITYETDAADSQSAQSGTSGAGEAVTESPVQNAPGSASPDTVYTVTAQVTDTAQSESPSVTQKESTEQTGRPSSTEQAKPEQTVRPSASEQVKPEQTVKPAVTEQIKPLQTDRPAVTEPGSPAVTMPSEQIKPSPDDKEEGGEPAEPETVPTRSPDKDPGNNSGWYPPTVKPTQSPIMVPTTSPIEDPGFSEPSEGGNATGSPNGGNTSGSPNGWPGGMPNHGTFAPPPSSSNDNSPTVSEPGNITVPDRPVGAPSTGTDSEFAGPLKAVPGYPYQLLYRVKKVTPKYRSDEIFEDSSGSWLVEDTDSYRICLYSIHTGSGYNPDNVSDDRTYTIYVSEEYTIAQILSDSELRITLRGLIEAGVRGTSAD